MIPKEELETLKRTSDLVALVQSRGITLTKNGKGYTGRCPFHEDTDPSLSVNPETNLWQCFGCGAGGDVIRFVELLDKVNFPEAVRRLREPGAPIRTAPPAREQPPPLTAKDLKLLARVTAFYQQTFAKDPAGLNYLRAQRGIKNTETLTAFGTGYANGTLTETLPRDEEILETLKRIGILTAHGREFFQGSVVFPLTDDKGTTVNLYGRRIDPHERPAHLYLPGPRRGLATRPAVNTPGPLLFTESVIDALTLHAHGFKNTVALYGVNGLTADHLSFLNRLRGGQAWVIFDADEAGHRGGQKLAAQLRKKNLTPHIVTLPAKDVNEYFHTHTADDFKSLLKKSASTTPQAPAPGTPERETLTKETAHGFIVGFGDRQYQLKGLHRSETQLKVTVKASTDVEGRTPFELTTVDLYSARSRLYFGKLCAALFGCSEEQIREDLSGLLRHAEAWRPGQNKREGPTATPEEKRQAAKFLQNPDMFREILSDMETLGVTGEEVNKLVGYLAAVSRKLEEPLSVLVQSRSAAGKSTLQDAVLSLVPEEDYVKYTRITDQALFYKDPESMVHKLMAIEEEVGMGGAGYSIRNMQSAKQITVAATGKDPATGKLRTEEYTVKGPVAVMITTTAAEVEGETASRFLFLTIDESAEMTRAIHTKQRESETLEGLLRRKRTEKIRRKHHTAQRMLKPLAVVNPYTAHLRYPSGSLRTRRDHKKYLSLIRAIAFLHQHQREQKTATVDGEPVTYVEVTLEDIDKANRLANEVLGQSLDDLARPSRTLLESIQEMVRGIAAREQTSPENIFFTRRMIREHTGWSDWQVKSHVKQLEDLEYLSVRMGAKGKEYSYALSWQGQGRDRERFLLNLTPVEELRRKSQKA